MIAQAGKAHRRAHGCLPTARQRTLIQACAAQPDLARTAWHNWRLEADLAAVDVASARLLLWVYHRREELSLPPADVVALDARYRQAWLRNQVLLNRCAEVVHHLQTNGIDCLLLKGVALLPEIYGDEGGRYLEDFDVLVRVEQVPQAVAALNALGWWSPHPKELSVGQRHAHAFRNVDGVSCDLHWRLFWRPHAAVDEAPLWAAKRPIRIRDTSTFTLSVEHLLLHLCVHGMAWETVPPIRWLLDVHLLRQSRVIHWEGVLAEAERRGVTLPLAEALAIYEEVLPGEIPAEVHHRLREPRVTQEERSAYAKLVAAPTVSSILSSMVDDWKQARKDGGVPGGLRGALRFLCLRWRVQSAWALPGQFTRRFLRRWHSVKL